MHIQTKHKENNEILYVSSDNINSEPTALVEKLKTTDKCDQCLFVASDEEALKAHKNEHEQKTNDVKLEIFGIVDFGNNVLDARNYY